MSELKPCPFCGGQANVRVLEYGDDYKVWGVFCESDLEDEYSHGHFVDNYATEAEAVAAWNSRVERTCRDVSVDSSTQFYCSECECTVDIPILWGTVNYCPNCGAKVVSE